MRRAREGGARGLIRIPNPRRAELRIAVREGGAGTITFVQSFDSFLMRIFIPRAGILERVDLTGIIHLSLSLSPQERALTSDYENNLRPPSLPHVFAANGGMK